jgi:LPXTG-motif cell wall-anchored protein
VSVAAEAPTAATAATGVGQTDRATTPARPTQAETDAVIASLPVTGGDSWVTSFVGAALVAVGIGLISFARRPRPTA